MEGMTAELKMRWMLRRGNRKKEVWKDVGKKADDTGRKEGKGQLKSRS